MLFLYGFVLLLGVQGKNCDLDDTCTALTVLGRPKYSKCHIMFRSCVLCHVQVMCIVPCSSHVYCAMFRSCVLCHVQVTCIVPGVLYHVQVMCAHVMCVQVRSCVLYHVQVMCIVPCSGHVYCALFRSCILCHVHVICVQVMCVQVMCVQVMCVQIMFIVSCSGCAYYNYCPKTDDGDEDCEAATQLIGNVGEDLEFDSRVEFRHSGECKTTQTVRLMFLNKILDDKSQEQLFVCSNLSTVPTCPNKTRVAVSYQGGDGKYDIKLSLQGLTLADSGNYQVKVEVDEYVGGRRKSIFKNFHVTVEGTAYFLGHACMKHNYAKWSGIKFQAVLCQQVTWFSIYFLLLDNSVQPTVLLEDGSDCSRGWLIWIYYSYMCCYPRNYGLHACSASDNVRIFIATRLHIIHILSWNWSAE